MLTFHEPKYERILRIAAFDFDDTLVQRDTSTPKFSNVKAILTQFHEEGWTIMIFTNQGGVAKKKTTTHLVEQRIKAFLRQMGIPIYVYAAIAYDDHRKPHTGMWKKMLQQFDTERLFLEDSFFVGDAAGRQKSWQKGAKRDFSCSDRKFASNIGIEFDTPEHFFLSQEPTEKWEWGGFDPHSFVAPPLQQLQERERELLILIGPQASGKSTLCKMFPSYVRVNRDTLKNKAKCLTATAEAIKAGKSVIIDNTNPDVESREPYITLARAANYHVRFININVDKVMATHLDEMRVELSGVKPMPAIAFNIFFKKNRESPPTPEECDELVQWHWQPNGELPKEFYFRY